MLKTTFPIEETIGMLYYLTDTPGIGGYLKEEFSDFEVNEVPMEKPFNEEGEFTHFMLEKTNWDTIRAINMISRGLGVSRKRIGFAGTKDKRALTRQKMSIWKVEPERLEALSIKDMKISDFKKSSEKILVGDLLGNEFKIILRGSELNDKNILNECTDQINERSVPNFFGYQRFGVMRPNTHIVGRKIVDGDIEGAVMSYLADYYDAEREDAYNARKNLKETGDFKKALNDFPKRLGYERTMIDHLHKRPNDYAGALRRLHKKLRQMLVHGVQSYIFNLVLSRMIENEIPIREKRIPLIGYKTNLSVGEIGEIEQNVLEDINLRPKDFKIQSLPELSSKGSYRKTSIETTISFEPGDDGSIQFRFFLPPGNYATMIMREIMKADPIKY